VHRLKLFTTIWWLTEQCLPFLAKVKNDFCSRNYFQPLGLLVMQITGNEWVVSTRYGITKRETLNHASTRVDVSFEE